MEYPELSIIIPHFNTPDLLKVLLNSIPADQNFEIIVIDDNSTLLLDEYNALTQEAHYTHVTFLKNTAPRKGPGTARNIGIKQAQGEWILFADADDFFLPNAFQEVKQYLRSTHDVVFFPPTSIVLGTNQVANRHIQYNNMLNNYLEKPSKENELMIRYKYTIAWSRLVRRSFLIEHAIFFDEVICGEDLLFIAKIGLYMTKFFIATQNIYCATHREDSLTTTLSKEVYGVRVKSHIRYFLFLKKHLSKDDFKLLKLSSAPLIFLSIKKKLGFFVTLKVVFVSIFNGLPLSNNFSKVIRKHLFGEK